MGCYVIAVGGTGNKILESVVYGACADVFYTVDERGRRTPIPRIRMLSVDVDAACGNTTRAKRAGEYYETVRRALSSAPRGRRGFHTALQAESWSMNLSKRAASVSQMSQNRRSDQLLARALYTQTEAQLEYSEGFRGHPDLGVLFFADLLSHLGQDAARGQTDELLALMADMQSELDGGQTVKLLLCGSIFGGTGASGIPAISRFLRRRFAAFEERFELASVLMLPYYQVPPAARDEREEIVVKSAAFLDKARTALQYYGMDNMLRDGENDPVGVFDAVYLLGLPPESFVTTRNYSTGSQSQENDAHMLEWLATRCIARFFRTSFRGEGARHIDCYYYQWHTPRFCWRSFDSEDDLYRVGYGSLLKAAAVFFAECYPALREQIAGEKTGAGRVNYCAPYFHRARRYTAAQRAGLEELLQALYHFFAFYANWVVQLVRALPPDMQKGGAPAQGSASPAPPASAPAPAPAPMGVLPENELVDAGLLAELYELLRQYGAGPAERDAARMRSACARLQKGLHRLVVQRVPDTSDMARVIAGLGGGKCDARDPSAAFAGFLCTLMQAVSDEQP